MKKIFLVIFIANYAIYVASQISTITKNDISVAQTLKNDSLISIVPYDSLQPIFIKENDTIQYEKYIGQKLFLPQTSEETKGIYYTIIDIEKEKFYPTLKLRDDETGAIVKYKMTDEINSSQHGRYYTTYKFITVGYFLKIQQLYQGKDMIWFLGTTSYRNVQYPEIIPDEKNFIYDHIASKSFTRNDSGTKFKCVAIKLSDENEIIAILHGKKDTITVLCPENLYDKKFIEELFGIDYYNSGFTSYISPKLKHTNIGKFLLEEDVKTLEADNQYKLFINGKLAKKEYDPVEERLKECVQLFGEKNGKLIANYKITLGMTRKMCEAAGFSLQSTTATNGSKVEIFSNRFEKAVLTNGVVTKIYK